MGAAPQRPIQEQRVCSRARQLSHTDRRKHWSVQKTDIKYQDTFERLKLRV